MKSPSPRSLVALLGLLSVTTGLQAQLSVYEGFEYEAASTLPPTEQSGFGWNGGWYNDANSLSASGSRGVIQAGSLPTPPGLIASGNHLARGDFAAGGERMFAEANQIDTNENRITFFSVIGQVTTNSWSFGLYSDRGRLDPPVVSFSLTAGSATMRLYDAFPYETADGAFTRTIASGITGTFFWVGRLETTAGNDRLDSWIYTDLANIPVLMPALQGIPGPGVVPGSNVNIFNVDAQIDRVGYYLNAGSAIDEIRIGSDWQSVTLSASAVPEPSTYAFLFGAIALIGTCLHRRRKASAPAL